MPIDLKKFEGTLPYDSQMYGIYQPLLGWKSEPQSNRLLNGLRFLRQRYLTGLTRTVFSELYDQQHGYRRTSFSAWCSSVHVGAATTISG